MSLIHTGIGDNHQCSRRRGVLLAHVGRASRFQPFGARDSGFAWAQTMSEQASVLATMLPEGWRVFVATRHGRPTVANAVKQIVADGIEELVVIPMHPHFSPNTTGAIVRELYRVLRKVGPQISVATCTAWYDDAGYVNAQARRIAEYVSSKDLRPQDTELLFSAAGMARHGEPYTAQVKRTVQLVAERLGWPLERVSLEFQGSERVTELNVDNATKVLVCPLTFPVDYIGLEHKVGSDRVLVCPPLHSYEPFITALKNLALRGIQPVSPDRSIATPLIAPGRAGASVACHPESLVMIGASLANMVPRAHGPQLRYSDPTAFKQVKKSRKALRTFLKWAQAHTPIHEALVWNTCQRIEFYGWLPDSDDVADRECLVARIRHQLYGPEPEGLQVNVLFGTDAWHHLMRTACGLNSGLPGDTDVLAQLQTAYRIAKCVAAAGPRATGLVERAERLAEDVCAETRWGRFATGFCSAALSRILRAEREVIDDRKHLVIGGSTTSHSILSALSDRLQVSQRQMTLVYRDHHGQMKRLRTALGHGKRLRVHSYAEQNVLRAIAETDYVFFGIDQPEPVLEAKALHGLRDFATRPLTIVDFNSFGSMGDGSLPEGVNLLTAGDLEREVASYANVMCTSEQFSQATEEAEEFIEKSVLTLLFGQTASG